MILLAKVLFGFRRFRWFAIALAAMLAQDLTLLPLQNGSVTYFTVWVAGFTVVLFCFAAASIEAFQELLSAYHGIGRILTWIVAFALITGFLAMFLSAPADVRSFRSTDRILALAFATVRISSGILAVFLAAAGKILLSFELSGRPNDRRHVVLLALLLSVYTIAYFLKNALRQYLETENWIEEAAVCACLTAWIFSLSRAGETPSRSTMHAIDALEFRKRNDQFARLVRAVTQRQEQER